MKLSSKYIYLILFILIIVYLLNLYNLKKKKNNIENFYNINDFSKFGKAISGDQFDENKEKIPIGLNNASLTGQSKCIKPRGINSFNNTNEKKYLYPALAKVDRVLLEVNTKIKQYLPVGKIKTGTYKIYKNKKWPIILNDDCYGNLLNQGDLSSHGVDTKCKKLGLNAPIRLVNLGQNEARQLCLNDDTCDSIVIPKYKLDKNSINKNLGTCKMYAIRPGFPDELESTSDEHTIMKNYYYTFTISFYIKIDTSKTNIRSENQSGILYYGSCIDRKLDKIGSPIISVQSQLANPNIKFEYVVTGNENNKDYKIQEIKFPIENINRFQNVIIVVNQNDIYAYVDGIIKYDGHIEDDLNKSKLDYNYKYFIFPSYQSVIIGKNPKYSEIYGDFEIDKLEWMAYAMEKNACQMFPFDNHPYKIKDPIESHIENQRTLSGKIHFNYEGASKFLCDNDIIDSSFSHNKDKSNWIWREDNNILKNSTSHVKIHNIQNSINNNIVFIDGYIKCNKSFEALHNKGKPDSVYTLENPEDFNIVGCIPKSFWPNRNIYFLLAMKGGYMIMKINNKGKMIITPPSNMKYIKDTPISLFNIRYIKDPTDLSNGIYTTDKILFLSKNINNLDINVYNTFYNIYDKNSTNNLSKVSVINNNEIKYTNNMINFGLDGITLLKKINVSQNNNYLIINELEPGFKVEENTKLILVKDKLGTQDNVIKISGNIYINYKFVNKDRSYLNSNKLVRINRKEKKDSSKGRYMDKYMQLHSNICSNSTEFCDSCADKAYSIGHTYYGIGDIYKECLTGNSYDDGYLPEVNCKEPNELTNNNKQGKGGCDFTMNIYDAGIEPILIFKLKEKKYHPSVNMIFLCASQEGTVRILLSDKGEIYLLSNDFQKKNHGKQEENLINLDSIIYKITNLTIKNALF